MKPIISVIIPVYNVEPYIKKCVESILSQEFKALEVLAVDDGSTDASGRILDEMAAADPRLRVLHIQNGGVSNARNTGLRAAEGDCIGFVDGDDYVSPRMFGTLYSILEREGADMVQCGTVGEGKSGLMSPMTWRRI